MAIKTFTAAPLTASDVNTYLMKQAVITCTSGTRPGSPVNGMTIYETDTSRYMTWNGSAWIQYVGETSWRWAAYVIGNQAVANSSWSTIAGYNTAFTGMPSIESGRTGLASYGLGVITATVNVDVDVTFSVVWAASAVGRRGIRITMDGGNNTTPMASTLVDAVSGGPTSAQNFSGPLAAGHTLEVQVYQDSGASLDITYRSLSVRATRI